MYESPDVGSVQLSRVGPDKHRSRKPHDWEVGYTHPLKLLAPTLSGEVIWGQIDPTVVVNQTKANSIQPVQPNTFLSMIGSAKK